MRQGLSATTMHCAPVGSDGWGSASSCRRGKRSGGATWAMERVDGTKGCAWMDEGNKPDACRHTKRVHSKQSAAQACQKCGHRLHQRTYGT